MLSQAAAESLEEEPATGELSQIMSLLRAAVLVLLLLEDFEVLVNDGNGKQNARARSNGAKQISKHRECANAQATKGSGGGDVALKDLAHGGLVRTHTNKHHLLVGQLLGNVLGRRARDLQKLRHRTKRQRGYQGTKREASTYADPCF